MAPDVTLAEGVPEEDVVGKQDGARSNRDVGVPEEEVVGKQEGARSTEPTEGLRKTWVEKNGAVRIGSRRWPQECQPCGLVDENGRNTPVS